MTNERKERLLEVLAKRQNDLTVVMENVVDPHNIAAVMRSCDAVGIQDIYVLNTKIPRHNNWTSRSSRSASKWLTIHQFTSFDECIKVLKEKYSRILTTHLSTESVSLYETNFVGSVAVVFGNEQYGITEEMLAVSDGNIIVPQVGMVRSLNISVACAVTLYEAFRQKTQAGHYQQQKISQQQFTNLYKLWNPYDHEII